MPARTWLGFALALVIGFALGAWFGGSPATAPDVVETGGADDASVDRTGVSDPVLHDGGTDRRAVPASSEPRAPVLAQDAVPRAIERVPEAAPFEAQGGGVVTGRVLDLDGAPVAGAAVFGRAAAPEPSPRAAFLEQRRPPAIASVDEALDAAAQDWLDARATTSTAFTDEHGAFVLDGLATGVQLDVRAFHDDYLLRLDRWAAGPITAGAEVEFVALRSVEVSFDVRDAYGEPVDSASLAVWSDGNSEFVPWSRARPSVWLIEGPTTVRAAIGVRVHELSALHRLDEHCIAQSQPAPVMVREGIDPVVLELEASAALVARLVFAEPVPEGFEPHLIVRSPGDPSPVAPKAIARMRRDDSSDESVQRWSAFGLQPGAYVVALVAGHPFGPALFELEFEYIGGVQEVVVEVPPLEAVVASRVRVLDGADRPVRGARFFAARTSKGRAFTGAIDAEALGDGWYEVVGFETHVLRHPPVTDDEGVESSLSVSHPEFGRASVELVDGQLEYVVRLEAPDAGR